MKLNKEQRLTMYLIMMAEIEYAESINQLSNTNETYLGFCAMLVWLTNDASYLNNLPELIQQCQDAGIDTSYAGYWLDTDYHGWLQRKELLQHTIDTMLTA